MTRSRAKVLLAMSGGVDSSVAAALLLREGYDVIGCFMRLGSPGETFDELIEDNTTCDPRRLRIGHQGCCSINDAADARLVAAKLGIPFYVCNFKKDFGRIIDYFVEEYNAGRTPNPCVRCNDWLKFGKLHEYARQIDAQYVASGHYARIARPSETAGRPDSEPGAGGNEFALLRGVDLDKDQSYVLFGVPRDRLREMLLPIGGCRKSEVRRIARELNLPVFDKPDSQEICFVPDNDYAGLVKRRSPERVATGRIIDTSGEVLGEHDGHQHFTIGQRKGLRISRGHPLYVIDKDAATNSVIVGERDELRRDSLTAREVNWLIDAPESVSAEEWPSGRGVPPDGDMWLNCCAKIRYNADPQPARVCAKGDDEIEVVFDQPQLAIAPGQAVVCYRGEQVICGGWISGAA
jgi:tRNA-specific 2-thiouridylase